MLHLTNDAAKCRDVASQNTGLVHQSDGVRDAVVELKQADEFGTIFRVAPKLRCD